MQEMQALKVHSYLSQPEIQKLLEGVEFIIMASPSMMAASELPLHFTIILNTSEVLPEAVKPQILEKFCREYAITETKHVLSNLERVAFALTTQETPMPHHIIDDAEANTIPWTLLHVIDFLGDSDGFKEAKDGFTGWSYSYN